MRRVYMGFERYSGWRVTFRELADTHVKFLKSHPADFLVKAGLRHDVECSTES
jgi:hypothetical protein